jgi:predicted SprT family Zn-dependent metalloprotease
MSSFEEQIIARSRELLAKSGITLPVDITFDPKLKSVGVAKKNSFRKMDGIHLSLSICYNSLYMNQNFDAMLNEVVPHEVAHIVQFMKYPFAKQAHGPEWKRICRSLGGNGQRCTQNFDGEAAGIKKNKMTKYEYTCACKQIFQISPQKHRKIQSGVRYRCLKCQHPIMTVALANEIDVIFKELDVIENSLAA